MSMREMTRAFNAGFSAGACAGFTMDVNDVDVSTEPYIVEVINRALESQGVDVEIDHAALDAVLKAEEAV